MSDVHTHCSCNGVWLCSTCHGWVHAHPYAAHEDGWIVSRHETFPGWWPVVTPWGTRFHDCLGGYRYEGE